jgi:catechol 2,3-dioxygenase-like lactoylglutathione lyase family enzyme
VKLAYIRLLVRDFDACVAFYRDVIGFPVAMHIEHAKFAEFDTGETALEIYDRGQMAEIVGRAATPVADGAIDRALLTLQVTSLDEAYASLTEKGVQFDVPPTDRPDWGARTAHFRDPDGNLLELFQHVVTESRA